LQTFPDFLTGLIFKGLSRAAIFKQVDDSLKRLGTDYIDVLAVHRFDHSVPPEETMKALHDLIQANKVRYIGASSMWAHELAILQHVAERNGWTKFISMQNHYNLLYREEEREMNKYCRMSGVGLIPVSHAPFTFLLYRYPRRGFYRLRRVGKVDVCCKNIVEPAGVWETCAPSTVQQRRWR
jgi:aryl-alcohol dehydrogenase-like predicted oxidoreductase